MFLGGKEREREGKSRRRGNDILPLTTGDELEWSRADLLTRGRDTDDDTLSPTLMARFERGAHDVHIAGAVEGVIAAAVGHLDQFLLDGLLAELGGVDEVGGTELLAPFLLLVVGVHHDYLARAALDRALDHGQPDAPRAEDGDVGALFHLCGHHRGAVARCYSAAQQARAVHGGFGFDGHDGDVGDDGELGEGGCTHEVEDVLAFAFEA